MQCNGLRLFLSSRLVFLFTFLGLWVVTLQTIHVSLAHVAQSYFTLITPGPGLMQSLVVSDSERGRRVS